MKFDLSRVKLVRPRGLELADLLTKHPENKNIYISYNEIHIFYNVKPTSYNGYARIVDYFILPYQDSLKKHLGMRVHVKKIDNYKMCCYYTLDNLNKKGEEL